MAWLLTTPSSRGIGHALTRQLLRSTSSAIPIVATTRGDPKTTRSSILSDLNLDHDPSTRLDVQKCDLSEKGSISELAGYCKDKYQSTSKEAHLRLAFCVPGILFPERSPSQIDYEDALATLKMNLLAPMLLLKHFSGFLPRKTAKLESLEGLPAAAVLAFMSARVGSITDNGLGGWYSYRSSKAGLNQLVKTADIYQRMQSGKNACVVGLHPGTVKTGLSKEFWGNVKEEKLFSPEFASEQLCEVVGGVGGQIEDKRGKCWDWQGKEVPP